MASSVHPFQPMQAYDANAPPPNYGNPGAYGSPNGSAPPGYGYGAPNGAVYGSAPPPGYAYGAPGAASYPLNGAAQGYPPPGGYAYAPPPGSAPGYPNTMPPGSAPGYPSGAPPPDGVQPFAYGAPGAVVYPPNGSAQGYPPVNSGAPGYAYGAPNGAPGYPPANGGMPVYPIGGAVVYPLAGAGTPGDGVNKTGANGTYPPPGQQVPTTQVHPHNDIQTGRWAAGLCSCCDHCVPNCFMSWCLPFVALAQVYARMGIQPYMPALIQFFIFFVMAAIARFVPSGGTGSRRRRYATTVVNTATSSNTTATPLPASVVIAIALAGQLLFRAMVWRARNKIRARFAIPGNCCTDGLASCCCSCCAIAQMATHVKSYKPGSCSFLGPDVLPPYPG